MTTVLQSDTTKLLGKLRSAFVRNRVHADYFGIVIKRGWTGIQVRWKNYLTQENGHLATVLSVDLIPTVAAALGELKTLRKVLAAQHEA